MNDKDGKIAEADKQKLGKALSAAFVKYREFFGVPPHGTEQQMLAMMELGYWRVLASILAKERAAALEEAAKRCEEWGEHPGMAIAETIRAIAQRSPSK